MITTLRAAGVPFEVIGGVAVNTHLFERHRELNFVTRDIHLLLNRSDLERGVEVAGQAGYLARKMLGGYALIRPQQKLGEAIHLIFVGEKSKSTQPHPHPPLDPAKTKRLPGKEEASCYHFDSKP